MFVKVTEMIQLEECPRGIYFPAPSDFGRLLILSCYYHHAVENFNHPGHPEFAKKGVWTISSVKGIQL